jgi:hypothetical protein
MNKNTLIGNFIKHKQAKDVCYLVQKIIEINGDLKYHLVAWNMGFEDSWPLQEVQGQNLPLENFLFHPFVGKGSLRNLNWTEIEKT